MQITKEHLLELLARRECVVLKEQSNEWHSGNSTVLSTPAVSLTGILDPDQIFVGASIVCIAGESGEPLHFHSSHLVGVVIRGSGWLCIPASQGNLDVTRIPVEQGDGVVIPRDSLHLFECAADNNLDYIALEFSDRPIDYQKHWTTTDAERKVDFRK